MSYDQLIDACAQVLAAEFPGTPFRVRDDAIGLVIFYTSNAPSAPTKVAVRDVIARRLGPVFVKIPLLVDRTRSPQPRRTLTQ